MAENNEDLVVTTTEDSLEKGKAEEVVSVEPQKEESNKKELKKEDKKNKKKKDKKEKNGGLGKKMKETGSELKKVTWPTFGQVMKKTGVVLAVVAIFTVVLFGMDALLGFLFKLLVPGA